MSSIARRYMELAEQAEMRTVNRIGTVVTAALWMALLLFAAAVA